LSDKFNKKQRNQSNHIRNSADQQSDSIHKSNKQQFDLSNYLEPAEIEALRRINPHNKTFETHLGKVIQSVSNRRKGNGLATIAYY
jgi:hypothetical protein